jgi:hypothetical protein
MDPVTLEGLRALIDALRERAADDDSYYSCYYSSYDEQLMVDAARIIELFIEAALGEEQN